MLTARAIQQAALTLPCLARTLKTKGDVTRQYKADLQTKQWLEKQKEAARAQFELSKTDITALDRPASAVFTPSHTLAQQSLVLTSNYV